MTQSQRKFGKESTATEVIEGHDLGGQDVIVTGGANGLGLETARVLAGAGARVVIAGRNPQQGESVAAGLRANTGSAVEFGLLDLASLDSVSTFVQSRLATGRPLHVLVNNAGVMATPLSRTAEGFELQFGTNHLGHFALTVGLLPALRAAGSARVVVLSSVAHRRSDVDFDDPNYKRRPYDPWQAYGQSKTANALFAVGLTERNADDGVFANSVMPGGIRTDLQRHVSIPDAIAMGWADANGTFHSPPGWKTTEQGAATSVWAAVAPELNGVGGRYLENCAIARPWTSGGSPPSGYHLPYAVDPEHARRLWTLSEHLVTR